MLRISRHTCHCSVTWEVVVSWRAVTSVLCGLGKQGGTSRANRREPLTSCYACRYNDGTPGGRGLRTRYLGFPSLIRQISSSSITKSSQNILFTKWRQTEQNISLFSMNPKTKQFYIIYPTGCGYLIFFWLAIVSHAFLCHLRMAMLVN